MLLPFLPWPPEPLAVTSSNSAWMRLYSKFSRWGRATTCTTPWLCWPRPWSIAAGWCFVAGLVLFCGSLYALSLTGVRTLGAITPLGGLAFMAGWLCLSLGAWKA